GGAGDAADGVTVYRGVAPADHAQTFFADDALEDPFAVQTRLLLDGKKCHPHCVFAGSRQSESQRLAFTGEELVGNLDEHASAVAGFRVAAAGATMSQVDQNLNPLLHDLMTLIASNAGYKPDTAGIVLVRRVVKTLRRRQAVLCLPALQNPLLRGKSHLAVGRRLVAEAQSAAGSDTTEGIRAPNAKNQQQLLRRARHDLNLPVYIFVTASCG